MTDTNRPDQPRFTTPRHRRRLIDPGSPVFPESASGSDTATGLLCDQLDHAAADDEVGVDGPAIGSAAVESPPVLFTPAQAALRLQVRESWLRRRAAQRRVPCTFLGKHLRFSCADLDQIITDAARPAVDRDTSPPSGRRGRSPLRSPVRPVSGRRRPGR